MRRIALAILIAGCAAALYLLRSPMETAGLTIGRLSLDVSVLRTVAQQEQGLGGLSALAPGQGALFVREPPDIPNVWMNGAAFPIDIIWVAPDGTILGIEHRIAPETHSASFSPSASVGWVLEVPADTAARSGITAGMSVYGLPVR